MSVQYRINQLSIPPSAAREDFVPYPSIHPDRPIDTITIKYAIEMANKAYNKVLKSVDTGTAVHGGKVSSVEIATKTTNWQ